MSRTGMTTRDRSRVADAPPPAPARPRRYVRRRGKRHPLLVAAVLPLVLASVAWVLWESPLLAVRTVQVDGARTLSVADVRDATGLTTGTPLLQVDVGAAAARVRRLPQVASAQVSRGWPDRIVVTLTERVPVAVVDTAGGRSLADRTGVLFETVTGAAPDGVVPLDVAHPGPRDAATRSGLAAIAALPSSIRSNLRSVSARTGHDVVLHLTDGTTVLWGDGDQAAAKAAALGALLHQIGAGAVKGAGTIDVSAPGAVVLR